MQGGAHVNPFFASCSAGSSSSSPSLARWRLDRRSTLQLRQTSNQLFIEDEGLLRRDGESARRGIVVHVGNKDRLQHAHCSARWLEGQTRNTARPPCVAQRVICFLRMTVSGRDTKKVPTDKRETREEKKRRTFFVVDEAFGVRSSQHTLVLPRWARAEGYQ